MTGLVFKDSSALEVWLHSQGREVCVAFAARAALRALPLVSRAAGKRPGAASRLRLISLTAAAFRAAAFARIAAKYRTGADAREIPPPATPPMPLPATAPIQLPAPPATLPPKPRTPPRTHTHTPMPPPPPSARPKRLWPLTLPLWPRLRRWPQPTPNSSQSAVAGDSWSIGRFGRGSRRN